MGGERGSGWIEDVVGLWLRLSMQSMAPSMARTQRQTYVLCQKTYISSCNTYSKRRLNNITGHGGRETEEMEVAMTMRNSRVRRRAAGTLAPAMHVLSPRLSGLGLVVLNIVLLALKFEGFVRQGLYRALQVANIIEEGK